MWHGGRKREEEERVDGRNIMTQTHNSTIQAPLSRCAIFNSPLFNKSSIYPRIPLRSHQARCQPSDFIILGMGRK